ncbi:MAG: N-formylglutamate amidohydrolase [Candidatus Eremiobacterota bacterium]
MLRLPLLLAIPNGGMTIPRELAPRFALAPEDLFLESEPGARELFAFGEAVQGRVEAEVARAVIDLDRDPRQRPPEFPDGVVKSVTRRGVPVWTEQGFPTSDEMERLVDRHHKPFHEVLERSASRGGVRLVLDCRVMHPLSVQQPDLPMFCLVNQGDDPGQGEETCPAPLVQAMEDALREEFSQQTLNGCELVQRNRSLGGGYLLKRHGSGRTPWIQLHLNPRLFLGEVKPGAIPDIDREAIAGLRSKLLKALTRFADALS